MTRELWTIGHSTREPQAFVDALQSFRIEVLADVRRFPHSRRHPHYNTDELKRSLVQAKIRYEYLGDELGGFRDPKPGSPNVGLGDSSFQGYADHLASPIFQRGHRKLLQLAGGSRVALMCSERNWKGCHRRIISDQLTIQDAWTVTHVLDADESVPHEPSPLARTVEGRLVYAAKKLDEFPG